MNTRANGRATSRASSPRARTCRRHSPRGRAYHRTEARSVALRLCVANVHVPADDQGRRGGRRTGIRIVAGRASSMSRVPVRFPRRGCSGFARRLRHRAGPGGRLPRERRRGRKRRRAASRDRRARASTPASGRCAGTAGQAAAAAAADAVTAAHRPAINARVARPRASVWHRCLVQRDEGAGHGQLRGDKSANPRAPSIRAECTASCPPTGGGVVETAALIATRPWSCGCRCGGGRRRDRPECGPDEEIRPRQRARPAPVHPQSRLVPPGRGIPRQGGRRPLHNGPTPATRGAGMAISLPSESRFAKEENGSASTRPGCQR